VDGGRNCGKCVIDAIVGWDHDVTVSRDQIVILAFEGAQSLDVVGPYEVFAGADEVLDSRSSPAPRYSPRLVGPDGDVRTESGLRLAVEPLPERCAPHTLLIGGGTGVYAACDDAPLVDWVRRTAARAERIATVCTGTFLAATAGLLDGRTVTTHWARAAQLAERFPRLTVDPDPIYRRDGHVWTSAGVTAGIDLALAMVAADHDEEVAQTVARWLVMFMHRPGGQTQFATPVWTPRAGRPSVRAAQDYIDQHPGADLRVERLAEEVAMSGRHFARVFTAQVGESPARYVERVRVEAARRELETTDATLDHIARHCGLGSSETLRRAFHRRVGVAPDAYRHRFRSSPASHPSTSLSDKDTD
jgi:transcriptional regulator GlxA family with amidase domain